MSVKFFNVSKSEKLSTPVLSSIMPLCFDVNIRFVIAFREIGKGHSAVKPFCGYMNMVPQMANATDCFLQYSERYVVEYYKAVAEISMKKSSDELKETSSDLAMSCDGA